MPIKLARPEILQQLPGCPVAVSICLAGDKTFRTDVAEVSMFSVIFDLKSDPKMVCGNKEGQFA